MNATAKMQTAATVSAELGAKRRVSGGCGSDTPAVWGAAGGVVPGAAPPAGSSPGIRVGSGSGGCAVMDITGLSSLATAEAFGHVSPRSLRRSMAVPAHTPPKRQGRQQINDAIRGVSAECSRMYLRRPAPKSSKGLSDQQIPVGAPIGGAVSSPSSAWDSAQIPTSPRATVSPGFRPPGRAERFHRRRFRT